MIEYIRADYKSHKLRMLAECVGMVLSVAVALLLAVTTPNPPMLYAYIGWNLASSLLMTCSFHRGSVGLGTMYLVFLVIDTVGLVRTIL
jgi:hypothetical protein